MHLWGFCSYFILRDRLPYLIFKFVTMKKVIIGFLLAIIFGGTGGHFWRLEQVRNITNENAHNFWELYYYDSLATVKRQCLEAIMVKEEKLEQRCDEELDLVRLSIRTEVEDSFSRLILILRQEIRELAQEGDSLRQEILLVHRSYARYGHQLVEENTASSNLKVIHQGLQIKNLPKRGKTSQQAAMHSLQRDFGRYILLLMLTPFFAGLMLRIFLRRD